MENTTPTAPQQPPQPIENSVKSNVAAALAYLFGIVGGLIVYLVYKDKFARFHGLQSILLSIAVYVLYYAIGLLPGLYMLRGIVGLASLVLTIYMIVKAYQGNKVMLPVIGDIAEKNS